MGTRFADAILQGILRVGEEALVEELLALGALATVGEVIIGRTIFAQVGPFELHVICATAAQSATAALGNLGWVEEAGRESVETKRTKDGWLFIDVLTVEG